MVRATRWTPNHLHPQNQRSELREPLQRLAGRPDCSQSPYLWRPMCLDQESHVASRTMQHQMWRKALRETKGQRRSPFSCDSNEMQVHCHRRLLSVRWVPELRLEGSPAPSVAARAVASAGIPARTFQEIPAKRSVSGTLVSTRE